MFGLPRMGLAGAAIATVIGQWIAAGLALFFNIKFNPDVQLGLKFMKPRWDILRPVLTVGVPSTIMSGLGSIMYFSMNQILLGFKGLGEIPAGVFGIYFKLQSFFFMPLFGLNNAAISILAFNYGARKPERITKTLKISLTSALTFMLVGLTVFQLFPETLLRIFQDDPAFLDVGQVALRIISLHFPLAAVCICLISSFQALGTGIYSTFVSLCRQMLALLPAAFLLSMAGNIDLVWWAFPIAELVSVTATLLFYLRIYRKKIRPLFAQ
jgi:Na+-driven multidrug efflux pump